MWACSGLKVGVAQGLVSFASSWFVFYWAEPGLVGAVSAVIVFVDSRSVHSHEPKEGEDINN